MASAASELSPAVRINRPHRVVRNAHHQGAFEAEVDAPRALGDALAEADEQKWRGDANRAAEHGERNRPESDRSIRHVRISLSGSQFARTARRWPERRRK